MPDKAHVAALLHKWTAPLTQIGSQKRHFRNRTGIVITKSAHLGELRCETDFDACISCSSLSTGELTLVNRVLQQSDIEIIYIQKKCLMES